MAKKKSVTPQKKSSTQHFVFTHILLSCGVIIAIGLSIWSLQRQTLDNHNNHALNSQIARLKQHIQQHNQKFEEALQQNNQLTASIGAEVQQQRHSDIAQQTLLQDIQFLLELTLHRAQTTHNPQHIIILLNQTALLASQGGIKFLALQKAIQDTVISYASQPYIDHPRLLSQLDSLHLQMNKLPLKKGHQNLPKPRKQISAAAPEKHDTILQAFSSHAQNFLSSAIRIHKQESFNTPISTPEQALNLAINLNIILEQARLAAMQHDTQTFTNSIKKLYFTLPRYYVIDTQKDTKILQTLEHFQTLSLEPPTLNIDNAIAAIKTLKYQMTNGTSS